MASLQRLVRSAWKIHSSLLVRIGEQVVEIRES
jgi:hypothetical protein